MSSPGPTLPTAPGANAVTAPDAGSRAGQLEDVVEHPGGGHLGPAPGPVMTSGFAL